MYAYSKFNQLCRRFIVSTVLYFLSLQYCLQLHCLVVRQVRGSIPIHWEQVVDLTYKPKIKPVGPHPVSA